MVRVPGYKTRLILPISMRLMAFLSRQGQRQKVGVKRKATKTAGQVLMMLSLGALTNLCGAGPEGAQAAAKLHHVRCRSPFCFVLFCVLCSLSSLFLSLMGYRKYRSLGTPRRLTFQTRLLHNQEGVNTDRYV